MFSFNQIGLTSAALLFVAMAPAQAAVISGQLSGFGSAGSIISQSMTDFANPIGGGNGQITVGANASNATGSYSGLAGVTGLILDFSQSGNNIGLANFIQLGTYSFMLDTVLPGNNYGGQNAWTFQNIPGSVIATLVVYGTVTNSAVPADSGKFQATFTSQFLNTTSAQLLSTLSGGGNLPLQSYSVSVDNATPEPGSWAMLLSGLGLVGAGIRSRRRNN